MQAIDYTAKIQALPMITDFERTEEEVEAFYYATNQEEFIYANTFCKQIGILCTYLRTEYLNVSYGRIGNLFGKSRSTVYDQYKNYMRVEGINGRPPSLTQEEMEYLVFIFNF